MDRDSLYISLLRQEVSPAVGCTEPAAVALACAVCRQVLGLPDDTDTGFDRIELVLSRNIIKNAMGVGIPGTGMAGIPIAAALGYFGGDPDAGLEVLAQCSEKAKNRAKTLAESGAVGITRFAGAEPLSIEAKITAGGHTARTVIEHTHDRVTRIEKDGEVLTDEPAGVQTGPEPEMRTASQADIFDFAAEVDLKQVEFLLEGARMNKQAAMEGLSGEHGLKVGQSVQRSVELRIMADSMISYAVELASAAADARMAGCTLPVMTNSGSGNQGITVSLPVLAAAEKSGADETQLHRALVLSNLTAVHARHGLGRLSALCGALTAGIGASAGIVLLLGGSRAHVFAAVQYMIADLTGMICDGAKDGCALKIATVVEASFRSAVLALDSVESCGATGINEADVERSIANLVRIGKAGMEETDNIILDIMVSKGRKHSGS